MKIEGARHALEETKTMLVSLRGDIFSALDYAIEHISEAQGDLGNNKNPRVLSRQEIEDIFGKFDYTDRDDGLINIAQPWAQENVMTLKIHSHLIPCHKLIAPQLAGFLTEVWAKKLDAHLGNYDGCWVARHMCWNREKPLSRHSWGIAIDFGSEKYPYGSPEKRNPEIIEIAEKWGFLNGQIFPQSDPMHFEWVRFVL